MPRVYKTPPSAAYSKLIKKVAKSSGYLEIEVKEMMAHTVAHIIGLINEYGAVRIENLGTLYMVQREQKPRVSALTGHTWGGLRRYVRFNPTNDFKRAIRQGVFPIEQVKNEEENVRE